MARVSHIEKPQSLEFQGFGEGNKFLSILLVGGKSGASGKTQNPPLATAWGSESPHRHHVAADDIPFAATFLKDPF